MSRSLCPDCGEMGEKVHQEDYSNMVKQVFVCWNDDGFV